MSETEIGLWLVNRLGYIRRREDGRELRARLISSVKIVPHSALARLTVREASRATLAGHQLEPWQKDGRFTAVTWCLGCGLALGVNSHPQKLDPETVWGSVSATTCPQKKGTSPIWAPPVMQAVA